MNKALLAILGGIVVIGGIILLATRAQSPTENEGRNGEEIELSETYTSEDLNFSINHTEQAEVSVEGTENRTVKFLVTGAQQEEGTEVTDGYVFSVNAFPKSTHTNLLALAQAQSNQAAQTGEVREPVSETNFQGNYALTFVSEFSGARTTHTLVENTAWYYDLSYSVAGDENGQYQREAEAMLRSFAPEGGLQSSTQTFESVSVALLDVEGNTTGKQRGCDRVVMVSREVEKTPAPLTSALRELFTLNEEQVDGRFNFIARTNDTLFFDRVVIENGVAKVYLTGEVSGFAGVCDNPRPMIQIEETALQFPSVRMVEIYLNNEKTDLQPDMQGEA